MAASTRYFAGAAAVLCLGAALSAHAQSNVQLYGLVDMSAGRFQNAGAPKLYKADSGNMTTSFFGLKGNEDLGGNLKAIFAIESFLRADSGASGRFGGDAFWARNAYVGLQGNFGSVTLGRNTTPYFVSTLIFNAIGDSFGFSPSIRQFLTPTTGLAFFGDTGWNNSLLYSSNNYGGLSFSLLGNLGEGAANSKGKNVGGNVLYFGGPFAATLAYQQVKNGDDFTRGSALQAAGFQRQDSYQLGASYDLNFAKFYGQYGQEKTKATVNTQTKIYGVGVSVPLGGGKILAQYGNAKPTTVIAASTTLTTYTNKTFTLGYDYNLSKQTDIYAMYVNDKLSATAGGPAKNTGNTLAGGIRLKF